MSEQAADCNAQTYTENAIAPRRKVDHAKQAERALIIVSLAFWLSISFLGMYTIIVETHVNGQFSWEFLHDVASGCLLMVVALLGVYWEVRSCRYDYLTFPEEVLQFLILTFSGCYVTAGPWSDAEDDRASEATTAFGRVLCIFGVLLALCRASMSCHKYRRRHGRTSNFSSDSSRQLVTDSSACTPQQPRIQ
eukprot:TRINITY_DN15340_c0_g1_i1.p1 TRINITY_DN15340_c0_g1~~TRINITY_DN15340_c0_g1_i1.p1  ORF type:complete len:193 (-),score=25.49 TRINITY_DN15340_c0_g1_i1:322-900(-)